MKVIVFDDDPTGSQTVYGCPLLLRWDQTSLIDGINNSSPLLFLLANTRSLPSNQATKRTREICESLFDALENQEFLIEDIIFVSRGDSTLRGHGVLEPEIINDLPAGGRRLVQKASGYEYTIVSGEVAFRNGEPTGALNGKLIRNLH